MGSSVSPCSQVAQLFGNTEVARWVREQEAYDEFMSDESGDYYSSDDNA